MRVSALSADENAIQKTGVNQAIWPCSSVFIRHKPLSSEKILRPPKKVL